jgi:hypothetical protein
LKKNQSEVKKKLSLSKINLIPRVIHPKKEKGIRIYLKGKLES